MKDAFFHETVQRGTPEFPLEYYYVDNKHPKYHMRTQWHNDIEIERVLKGSLNVQLGGQNFTLKENQCLIIPSGLIHSAEPNNCVYECIVFEPSIMYSTQQIRSEIKRKLIRPVFFDNNETSEEFFELLKKRPYDGYEFRVMSDLYNIIYNAIKNQNNNIPVTNAYRIDQIKPAINYIEENHMHKILIDDLALCCSMSKNYFCFFFKEVTGQTAIEYINTYRIEAACELLLSGKSVTDTALSCGFNDVSYFIHMFKKHMGISPKKYAELSKNKPL